MRVAIALAAVVVVVLPVVSAAGCADVLGIENFSVLDGGDGSPDATTDPHSMDAAGGLDATTALDAITSPDAIDDTPEGGGTGDDASSAPCLGGGLCFPGTCQIGQYACQDGGMICSPQMASNGTLCGSEGGLTSAVCSAGTCKACNTGGNCSTPNSCKKRVYVCSSGSAVCTDVGNADEGTPCTAGMYCYGGVCSACKVSARCPTANLCHVGTVTSCTGGGASCMDTGQPAGNGTPCGTNQVCSGGACVSCTANVQCPLPNPCHVGMTSCAAGRSVCTDTGIQQQAGTLCAGTNKCDQTYTCQGGTCTGSNAVTCKALDQCHVAGVCDPTTGACSNPIPTTPTPCTGSDKCNQTYMCQAGVCTGSNPVACSGAAVCEGGSCQCTGGTTDCSGTCVNTSGSDAANCGRCGHGCLGGGSCVAGACQPIAFVTTGMNSIVDFATDGNVVVFADTGNAEVAQVSTPGGTPIVLAGNGAAGTPDHVVIDGASGMVYWTASGEYGVATRGQLNSGSIAASASACGATTRALTNPGASSFDVLSSSGLSTVSVGTGCLADTTTGISSNLGASLSPKWVFGDPGNGVVVIGGNADGGSPTATIPAQPGVTWVSDDGTYGYWATSEPAIRRASISAPSAVSTVLANPGGAVGGLTTDGINVYYQTSVGISYVPVAGGSTGTLLTSMAGIDLRYATGAVYFLYGGVVYKIATP
jgi:hypothetical protein